MKKWRSMEVVMAASSHLLSQGGIWKVEGWGGVRDARL
jgi:hypothetical protein